VVWLWKGATGDRRLVAVNYASHQSQCYVRLPLHGLDGRSVRFADLMGPVGAAGFDRDRQDLDARGLYLDTPAWGYHVFDLTAVEEAHAGGGRRAQSSRKRVPAAQTQ
jgi:hypothetical protein